MTVDEEGDPVLPAWVCELGDRCIYDNRVQIGNQLELSYIVNEFGTVLDMVKF